MGPQILIAEDEHQLRQLLTEILERKNLRVAQAADGVEAPWRSVPNSRC